MRKLLTTIILGLLLPSLGVYANHGEFPSGWGAKSIGMGGIGVAHPVDTFSAQRNPAGIAWVDDQIDVGGGFIYMNRRYEYTGFPPIPGVFPGIPADNVKSGWPVQAAPGFGINKHLDYGLTAGFAAFAHGGAISNYPRDNPIFGTSGNLGIDYEDYVFELSVAYDIAPCHAVGFQIIGDVQKLKVWGFENLIPLSSDPAHVTNNGSDWSGGAGVRIGYIGEIVPTFTVGLAYSTKLYNSRFTKYRGILANHGRLDVPGIFSVGLAWDPDCYTTLAFDYDRVFYSSIRSLHNSIAQIGLAAFGETNGPGFGTNSQNIYRVGVERYVACGWTLRAGYSYNNVPFYASEIDFNTLSASVSRHHGTFGFTWEFDSTNSVDFGYSHSFRGSKSGPSHFPPPATLGDIRITSSFDLFVFNYTYKF